MADYTDPDPAMAATVRRFSPDRFSWVPGLDPDRADELSYREAVVPDVFLLARLLGRRASFVDKCIRNHGWSVYVAVVNGRHPVGAIACDYFSTDVNRITALFTDRVRLSKDNSFLRKLLTLAALERPMVRTTLNVPHDDYDLAKLLVSFDWTRTRTAKNGPDDQWTLDAPVVDNEV